MRRTQNIDGTIPLPALLLPDESHIAHQDSVGLYHGTTKSPSHQNGTVHLTSHRLLYVDSSNPLAHSIAILLSAVRETDHYAGFLKSSPKVTLFFTEDDNNNNDSDIHDNDRSSGEHSGIRGTPEPSDRWICQVCDESNNGGSVCTLCGLSRSLSASISSPTPGPISTSLPASPPPIHRAQEKLVSVACTACTFLNHPSLSHCEICNTPLPKSSANSNSSKQLKSAPISRASTPGIDDTDRTASADAIKVSFRKGGDRQFYQFLKRALYSKAWVAKSPSPVVADSRPGIHGLLNTLDMTSAMQSTSLSSALQDLEAFTIKAREMVDLARTFNAKLALQEARAKQDEGLTGTEVVEPEEARFIRTSLASLGLSSSSSSVTFGEIGGRDEDLARELANVLQGGPDGGLVGTRGLIGLDEVWGAWMRGRGVALLPPSTLPPLLSLLPHHTLPPLHTRTLPSGLIVLHTPEYTHAAFRHRLLALLHNGGKTTLEIALDEGPAVGVAMVEEMVSDCERAGDVTRDEPGDSMAGLGGDSIGGWGVGGGTQWWENYFKEVQWDGQD